MLGGCYLFVSFYPVRIIMGYLCVSFVFRACVLVPQLDVWSEL